MHLVQGDQARPVALPRKDGPGQVPADAGAASPLLTHAHHTHIAKPHAATAQATPIDNFFLAGSYTYQDYLDSMEGATRSGLMVADEIVARADKLAAAAEKAKATPVGAA